jgi:putative transposase
MSVLETPVDDTRPTVGIDVGVREFAHLSDGTVIPNPRALDQEERRLRRARLTVARRQRAADKRLGKRKKGERRIESKRLQRARKTSARLARRVANLRTDALHKATTWIAKTYSVAIVEDLHGKNMTRARKGKGRASKAGLNRAILDSGMLRLRPILAYKMPLYGGRLVAVPAAGTSCRCSRCGAHNDPGSSKIYKCESCKLVIDRDENASLNLCAAASCTVALAVERPPGSRGVVVSPKARAGRQTALIRQLDGGLGEN